MKTTILPAITTKNPMKTITNITYPAFALFAFACFAFSQQAPDSVSIRVITTFDYPGTGIQGTQSQKINDGGDIVGSYFDSNGMGRGFVRFRNGNFSAPIVEPNDTCNVTEGTGINNSRLICGEYQNGSDCLLHGYFLMGGNFREFDVPDSLSTEVAGVNNVGDFCGDFTDATGLTQGFVSLGGTITPFSVPGATLTTTSGLNSSNQAAGTYVDASGISHGFWRGSNGALHFPIDPPGSTLTILFGNNDSNWMVGRYTTADGVTHGLFFVPPNRFFTFDYPGSILTTFNGINRDGFVSGHYNDAAGVGHGIIARVRVGMIRNDGVQPLVEEIL
jgi:hypothetical protein